MDPKQRAADAALNFLNSDSVIGLGTGSTAQFFLRALAEALKTGRLKNIRGVPTSIQSERLASELGIPLLTLADAKEITVTIDGADEVSPSLDLIKGLGGALLREKIVAQNSRQLIIIADASKRVQTLGTKARLPVEVAKFGYETQEQYLRSLGAEPTLRQGTRGQAYVTDNGNYIFDCRFASIPDPSGLESKLAGRAGIVESGLFIGIASMALIADERDVQTLKRSG